MKLGNLKTVLFFIKNYKRYVFSILIISFLFAIFEGLNIAVLFPIINSALNIDIKPSDGSAIMHALNGLIGIIPIKDSFIAACIFIIIVVIVKNILRYVDLVLGSFASYKIWDDVQKKIFSKYINADYRYFLDHKQGEIVYRLYNAPAATGGALRIIPQFLSEVLKVFVIGILLFSMSFYVTCGVILLSGIFYLFTRNISKKVSYFLGKGRVEAVEQQNIVINEMINGIKQIKVFLAENRWTKEFYGATNKYFKLLKKDTLWVNMPASALEIFAMVSLSVFLIFIKKMSPDSLVSNLPVIGVFAYAFQRVMPSLSLITTLKMQIMGNLPVMEALYSTINEEMTFLKDGVRVIDSFDKKIEFDKVSFYYPGRQAALKNINISLEKNKCTAIVGPSGSGKTTIVNLIIRMFDPAEGAILIDGVDLKQCQRGSWLKKIGFVSQDVFMFHSSVRDNIAFGLDSYNEEGIIKASKIANAHDFVSKLPEGYDTIIGEKGMKLSGGEQQRIAIARAILRNPEILIFDEATSALDNISQTLIQNSINNIVKDHTVILIAHRLSTIANADKIIVLDKGVVQEIGAHEELIAKKSYYWRLYNNEKEFVR